MNNQNQVPVAYMAPPTSYPPPVVDAYNGPYVTAPPPMGYPTTKEGEQHWDGSVETKSKGDGFLRGFLLGYVAAAAWTCVSDENKFTVAGSLTIIS
ncbi:hypothetical protein CASFOL_013968 [Castilleja foliolosa]|uniref:Uncharacterized protein n=1 Tax=Castilleja foliolosa TaxID=1961234 RepID=A0ABD3DLI8_9LAMI